MEFKALEGLVDELIEAGPPYDPESMETLLRVRTKVDAVCTMAVGEFDTWGEWAPDGARNAASWVATKGRLPRAEAGRLVKRARALPRFPNCAEAWKRGELNGAYLDTLEKVRNHRTEEALERDEETLVGEGCRTGRFEDFVKLVGYWEQLADPDGTEEAAEERRNRRDVYLEPVGDMYLGQMTLDPISGAIVYDELKRLEEELFEADWKEARARLGYDPTASDLARTPSQRRADALVEMATRSRTAPPDGIRPAPLFSVLVDFPTLCGRICELAQGIAVTPGSLVPWMDRARIERAVYEPDNRVQVSATARLFTGATRRGIQLRDRECSHPYCDRPVLDCQVDHIQPFGQDGPTIQENGRLLCGYHNRLRNQRPPPPR